MRPTMCVTATPGGQVHFGFTRFDGSAADACPTSTEHAAGDAADAIVAVMAAGVRSNWGRDG